LSAHIEVVIIPRFEILNQPLLRVVNSTLRKSQLLLNVLQTVECFAVLLLQILELLQLVEFLLINNFVLSDTLLNEPLGTCSIRAH